jgi:hypothetical protein
MNEIFYFFVLFINEIFITVINENKSILDRKKQTNYERQF